ncbi:MAG: HAMP domain-containing histidine kinase [Clostridia bacterium]|nr:HAMP domain-containing histidine kinase [Clostridia bacterium]
MNIFQSSKRKIKRKKRSEKILSSHFWAFALLGFVLLFLIAVVVLYIVLNVSKPQDSNTVTIMLYVIPSCAVCLIVVAIFLNSRNQKRLDKLIDGLNRIADGDFSYRIENIASDDYNRVYSDFNKMAEELSSVQSLRESFVHDFSHEFKTPISSINGFANVLLEGNVSDEEQKQFLKIIADESQRLSYLSENTLMLSRLDNISLIGDREFYRLDLQIKDCVILLESRWAEKELIMSSDMEEAQFYGNAGLMQQVWVNLILNAVKFTEKGGEIAISVKKGDGKIYVSVMDTGVGMSAEVQGRIFDKYYQGDKSRSVQGNGLGLSIVKRIVELHEGKIFVKSEEGVGSVFTVELPVKNEE